MRATGIELAEKVAALRRPDAYPDAPLTIEVIETHMSFVFPTPEHAYKLKKPVRYPFLDFSTLALRRHYCAEELRLNQRLAPDVYLGVVALGPGPDGRLRIGAGGTAVEWLVQMRRLPRERMLDQRIRLHALAEHELVALAARLAQFYRSCAMESIAPEEFRRRLAAEIETDRSALEAHPAWLDRRAVAAMVAALVAFAAERAALLDERVARGRIVEGHGDLRPEHVSVCSTRR